MYTLKRKTFNNKTYKKGGKPFVCNEEEYETRLLQQLKHIQTTIQKKSKLTEKQVKKIQEILNSCKAYLDKPILLENESKAKTVKQIFAKIPDETIRKQLSDLYVQVSPLVDYIQPYFTYTNTDIPEYYIPTQYSPSPIDEPPPLIPINSKKTATKSKIILPISDDTPTTQVDYSAIRIPLPLVLNSKEKVVNENHILLEYWLKLFNKNGKTDQYNIQSFYDLKTDILRVLNTPILCDAIVKLVKNYNTSESVYPIRHIFCIVYFIVSIVSKVLHENDIATVLIKGGKSLQMYSSIVSDDIDILIVPKHTLADDEIVHIGKQIANLISWLTAEPKEVFPIISGSEICPSTTRSNCAHIIKCAYRLEEGHFIAILDIGLGYNHLDEYIKSILSSNNVHIHFYKYTFYYPKLSTIIQEKIYYILLYLYDNQSAANRYFRNRTMIALLTLMKLNPKKLFDTNAKAKQLLQRYIDGTYKHIFNKFDKHGYPGYYNPHNLVSLYPMIMDLFFGKSDHWICTNRDHPGYRKLFSNRKMVELKMENSKLQFEMIFDSTLYHITYLQTQIYPQMQNSIFPQLNY
jgi:hypothetical protein